MPRHLGHGDFRQRQLSGIELTRQESIEKIKAAFGAYLRFPAAQGGKRVDE